MDMPGEGRDAGPERGSESRGWQTSTRQVTTSTTNTFHVNSPYLRHPMTDEFLQYVQLEFQCDGMENPRQVPRWL